MNLASEYDAIYSGNPEKWTSDSHDKMVFEKISYLEPEKVLDVGCGNGHTINFLKGRWPGSEFVGVDLSEVALETARKKTPGARFIKTDILNFDSLERYDLILLIGVVEHLVNLRGSLNKVLELSDGVVFIEIPNCISYPTSDGREGYKRVETGSRQMEWHYFRETWEILFDEIGFKTVEKIVGSQKWNEFQWILTGD